MQQLEQSEVMSTLGLCLSWDGKGTAEIKQFLHFQSADLCLLIGEVCFLVSLYPSFRLLGSSFQISGA